MTTIKLNQRQQLWADYYSEPSSPGYHNATKSAELAGYKGDYDSLRNIGSNNLGLPHIQAYLENKRKDLRSRFQQEAENAFNVLLEIVNNPKVSPRTRLDACKDVLDRAGYKPSDKVELTGSNGSPVQYETRLTKEISNRAKMLMVEETVIDVPLVEE